MVCAAVFGTHVVCASARVCLLPGGLLPSQINRRSIVFRVLFQQTNKHTYKRGNSIDAQLNFLEINVGIESTVFGKHCECNAQKCTHLKRLPSLGSHSLLLSHCVLTQHEGKKNGVSTARNRTTNTRELEHATANYDMVKKIDSRPDKSFHRRQMPAY